MARTYSEKLRDPRWQRKRLEIFQRDSFACRSCGSTSMELQVHHRFYLRGLEPWEYDNDALATLCRPCHESVTAGRDVLILPAGKHLRSIPAPEPALPGSQRRQEWLWRLQYIDRESATLVAGRWLPGLSRRVEELEEQRDRFWLGLSLVATKGKEAA